MPNALQDKIDQRANLWDEMKKILDNADSKGDGLSAEERQKYDRLEADLDKVTDDIELQERHDERKRKLDRVETDPIVNPGNEDRDQEQGDKQYRDAWVKWMRRGREGLAQEERTVLQKGWVDGDELRAQGVATGAAGGFLVPQGFRQRLVETAKYFSSVRRVAEVIETETGNTLPWPTNDDTANVGALVGENTQVTEQDVTLGQTQLGAYMYSSKIVRVSFQLLQDSAFNLEAWLARKLGQRIGRIQNQHFTTGTGSAQPEGIQTNAVIGKTGAVGQTITVTYDDFIDLIHSVDAVYRGDFENDEGTDVPGGFVGFMMHDLSLAKARKLKDSQNRPLWEPSLQAGVPSTLFGHRYKINNDMPQMAASVKSILFGNFTAGYVIRDVTDVQILRLEERYAEFLQVGFLAFARSDGKQQDASAYRAYSNSAT